MRVVQQLPSIKAPAAIPLIFLLALGAVPPAKAASTPWQEGEGASVRLLTAARPDSEGRLRGVLDIFLQPGWKTYWRDPGPSGVPPSIDISISQNVAAAELHFPAPERHDDGYGAWSGYGSSVSLPVTFQLADPAKPARIEANVFLGVCKDICVPFSARLRLDPAEGGDPDDDATTDQAFAQLPKSARPAFGVESQGQSGGSLHLVAQVPEGSTPHDIFIAGAEEGYAFGPPSIRKETAGWRLDVPLYDHPRRIPSGVTLPYTLVTDRGSVAGTLPPP